MKTLEAIQELICNEKDTPCVSMVVPLAKTLPARRQNELRIKKIMHNAKTQLLEKYDGGEVVELLHAIDELPDRIDFSQHMEGVGLFVSKHTSKLLYFPFSVEEKVVVNDSFEVRDLILNAYQSIDYWVLCLSNNHTRLLRGQGKTLEEIQDEHFPMKYEEQFEYAGRQKPRMKGSVVYGTDESLLKEERQREYFRHVDKLLDSNLKKEHLPLFLIGVPWYQPIFQQVTHHASAIASFMAGNYDHLSAEALVHRVWPEVENYDKREKEKILADIEEKVGQRRGFIYGVQAVWQAVKQGKGALLVVEKDYMQPVFYDPATGIITIEENEGSKSIKDAVEEIIKEMLNFKGKVVFMDHGQLEKYQRIALRIRY